MKLKIIFILCIVLFLLSLAPWSLLLLSTMFLYDAGNYMTSLARSQANLAVIRIFSYPLIGIISTALGLFLYKKGKHLVAVFLSSIPIVIVLLLLLYSYISN